MKKILLCLSICILVCVAGFVCGNCWRKNKMQVSINSVIGEKRFLEDYFDISLSGNVLILDSTNLIRKEETKNIFDVIELLCLIIYTPSMDENVCMSCINYAIQEVKKKFTDYSFNRHICIISVRKNPELKERIIKKKCYYVEENILGVSKKNVPYYFVIDENRNINDLFIPNSSFKSYTDTYLKRIDLKYGINDM